jgi:hypothetical protein
MGFLDFLRPADRAAFEPTDKPNLEPKGGSGRQHTDGFLDYDETEAALTGRAGLEVFDLMWRDDSDCRRSTTMCVTPVVQGTWTVEPYCDDDSEAEPTQDDLDRAAFVHWCLFERMRPNLPSHMWTALTVAARSGFAPFEQLYELTTWRGRPVYAIKTLDLRLPRSVDRWVQAGPDLAGIEQFAPGQIYSPGRDVQQWRRSQIPAEDLVYYRFGAEGDNWEGQSLLRSAHKNWKYKTGLELIDAIGHERSAVGVPTGYPAQEANEEDLDTFEEFLQNVRASDATYLLAPGPHAQFAEKGQGWYWEFVVPKTSQGAAQGLKDSLSYHRDGIAAAIVGEFMRLGQNGEGARATADVQQDPFWMLADTFAQIIVADTLNEQLIPRLVKLNFGDDNRVPKLKCSLIDSTSLTELADYVQKLGQAGALRTEDPALEEFLRKRGDLPEADEEGIRTRQEESMQRAQDMAQATAPKPDPNAPPTNQPDAKAKPAQLELSLDAPRRELRSWEQPMSLDRIESAIDGARHQFEQACRPHVLTLAASLAEQAVKGKAIKPAPAPTELVDAIQAELEALHATGADTVREELQRQQYAGTFLSMLDANGPDMRGWAQRVADFIRQQVANVAMKRAQHRPGDLADTQQWAERAGMAEARTAAMENAAAAVNAGRTAQADAMSDQIAGSRYTSILDDRACSPCKTADDDVLRPLNDPVRLARVPPNPSCDGGGRCRCMEAFQLRTEAPAAA